MRFWGVHLLPDITGGIFVGCAILFGLILGQMFLLPESPVIASIATGASTLIGAWIGGSVAKSSAERQWLKEQRLKAYTDLLREADEFVDRADAVHYATSQPSGLPRRLLLEQHSALYRAEDRVQLIGAHSVQKSLRDLVGYCGTILSKQAFATPKVSETEWTKIRALDYGPLYGAFKRDARTDLEKSGRTAID